MHRAIKETNVNHGLFRRADAIYIHGTEEVGNVSGRKLVILHRDDRSATVIPLSPSSLKRVGASANGVSRHGGERKTSFRESP